jgi:hypothetical protein
MVYSEHGLYLSDLQKKNVAHAVINNTGISLELLNNQLNGDFKLPLTTRQITRIKKQQQLRKGMNLKLSVNQLKEMKKSGGLLPLLALLPAIFGGLGAAGGIAGGVSAAVKARNDKIAAEKALEEQQRHNRLIEETTKKAVGTGIFLKSGEGVKSTKNPKVKLTASNLKKILNQANGTGIFLNH